jgi:hypothetical protein
MTFPVAVRTDGDLAADFTALARLAELADYIIPFAVRVVAGLGVADHLADGPRAVEDLARATDADTEALYRVLRALAAKQIFAEHPGRVFALTPMSQVLRGDHPLSVRDSYTLLDADVQAWARFDRTVRSGENAFAHVHGCSYWEYVQRHPDFRTRFAASMRAFTRIELHAILPCYDWAGLRTVVDLGGGTGALLAGLLAAHPDLHGTLVDLPSVVTGADAVLARAGVADRCTVVGGSFLDAVPAGADAYLMKRVLYSWSDADAVRILGNVRRAMTPASRLVLLDPVIRANDPLDMARVQDLLLLAVDEGHTRTRKELAALFTAAGLRLARMIPTPLFPITVAEPA